MSDRKRVRVQANVERLTEVFKCFSEALRVYPKDSFLLMSSLFLMKMISEV